MPSTFHLDEPVKHCFAHCYFRAQIEHRSLRQVSQTIASPDWIQGWVGVHLCSGLDMFMEASVDLQEPVTKAKVSCKWVKSSWEFSACALYHLVFVPFQICLSIQFQIRKFHSRMVLGCLFDDITCPLFVRDAHKAEQWAGNSIKAPERWKLLFPFCSRPFLEAHRKKSPLHWATFVLCVFSCKCRNDPKKRRSGFL